MAKNTARGVINNTPYYNDSLAYDFERFMPRKPKTENIIEYKPKIKTKARVKYKIDKLAVLCAIGTFATIVLSLFLRACISEGEHAVRGLEKEVLELQSEQTRLEFEYQKATSFSNLEHMATELGMRKITKDQVVYIFPHQENVAVLKDGTLISSNE